MMKHIACIVFCMMMILAGIPGIAAPFDDRFWEKYAGIELPGDIGNASLALLSLDPYQLGDLQAKVPFADFRIVSDRKEEIPCQIIAKRPVKREVEIPHEMLNLSTTADGATWVELRLREKEGSANAMQLVTPDTDYIRPVEVLGSNDGKTWNVIGAAGVLFDIARPEKMQNARVSFPEASFSRLALKIANGGGKPLSITGIRVLKETETPGQSFFIDAKAEKQQIDAARKESSIIVRMQSVFPVDRLSVETAETNFHRAVTVQKKNERGDWSEIAAGAIYSFDTPTMHLKQFAIEMPEVAAREFRLVFRDHDSPPLVISRVNGEGYRRALVFKIYSGRRLFLFWGNHSAEKPVYDLAGAIEKQDLDRLPAAMLGTVRNNTNFAGAEARMPFTERYRLLLSAVVFLAIAGLMVLQYRVFRRMKGEHGDHES
ncbi:MAG: DUF3999 domain-containing protein [Chlorobiaceae bacterium]|nr:DUF3999 domain-containing protein [Chlorobiaceae bacterium]NTV59810.1 DUF3999 domain-containing protein [Chlorobiaceae bacterium]